MLAGRPPVGRAPGAVPHIGNRPAGERQAEVPLPRLDSGRAVVVEAGHLQVPRAHELAEGRQPVGESRVGTGHSERAEEGRGVAAVIHGVAHAVRLLGRCGLTVGAAHPFRSSMVR